MEANMGSAKQRQVIREIELLGKSISGLRGTVESLEKSLSNISRPVIPSPVNPENVIKESDKNPEQLVELANMIREKRLSVDNTISRISDIVNRLEN